MKPTLIMTPSRHCHCKQDSVHWSMSGEVYRFNGYEQPSLGIEGVMLQEIGGGDDGPRNQGLEGLIVFVAG